MRNRRKRRSTTRNATASRSAPNSASDNVGTTANVSNAVSAAADNIDPRYHVTTYDPWDYKEPQSKAADRDFFRNFLKSFREETATAAGIEATTASLGTEATILPVPAPEEVATHVETRDRVPAPEEVATHGIVETGAVREQLPEVHSQLEPAEDEEAYISSTSPQSDERDSTSPLPQSLRKDDILAPSAPHGDSEVTLPSRPVRQDAELSSKHPQSIQGDAAFPVPTPDENPPLVATPSASQQI